MAFNDGTCPKCKLRFGWTGKIIDRPPCPKCEHQIDREDLEATEREMELFRKSLVEKHGYNDTETIQEEGDKIDD